MLVFLRAWLSQWLGLLGLPVVAVLGFVSMRGLVGDLIREEFLTMFWRRHTRTAVWAMSLTGIAAGSFLVPCRDHASGEFEIRALTRAELRAPVAGFLHKVHHDEGDRVSPGCEIAQLTIPDLASRLSRKEAELREAQAQLRLLQAGPRVEEIQQQRRRVQAAQTWRDVAGRNLQQQKLALEHELVRFDHLLQELAAECDYAQDVLSRNEKLRNTNAISEAEYAAAKKSRLVACAKRRQTEAERQSRAIRGTLAAESELAERDTELAREQATLAVLLAGTRPEEVAAAEASVERIQEELSYLHELTARLSIRSHVGGVITTCQLQTEIGSYFDDGELICEVEDAGELEIVIVLGEDQAARIQPGQKVRLKARSLPFENFEVEVQRIAPRAVKGDAQSKVNVYCSLYDPEHNLRAGMTGYARIECGRAPIATVLSDKCLRFIRTEFWW
jgi:putative peptide zinc metalloprotease protein